MRRRRHWVRRTTPRGSRPRLRADGLPARVERVTTPALADFPGGTLGWRVRVGSYATKEAAEAARLQVVAAGLSASTVYTGWDGDTADEGPWRSRS